MPGSTVAVRSVAIVRYSINPAVEQVNEEDKLHLSANFHYLDTSDWDFNISLVRFHISSYFFDETGKWK